MAATKTDRRTAPRLSREESRARIVAAATDLVRERSFHELSVGEVMRRAGIERTLFYRHFDDLADLLLQSSTEAIEALYETQLELDASREPGDLAAARAAIEPAARVYEQHGPLLRAIAEAGAANPQIKERGDALRSRFNDLIARSLSELPRLRENPPADFHESARALNLLNECYLRDAFGREPRVSFETAVRTLTEIWIAFIDRDADMEGVA